MRELLIAGLGNPDKEYEKTRHNVGFQIIDSIASCLSIKIKLTKFNNLYTKTKIENRKVILAKPMAYMNRSGLPLYQLANFFSIDLQNIIVIYDDVDLPFGKVKVKFGGGSAGHNGIKSIVNSFGDDAFIRLRFGIGKPENKETSNYVLSKFNKEEQKALNNYIEIAKEVVFTIVAEDVLYAMNKFNQRVLQN